MIRIWFAAVPLMWSTMVFGDINNVAGLNQNSFHLLSEDIATALTYRSLSPAEPLGVTGFDISVAVSYSPIRHDSAWAIATSNNVPSALVVPRAQIVKGLPAGVDVGLVYSDVPDTNIKYAGGEVKYAILDGSLSTPAVSIRLDYLTISGIDQLAFHSTGVDLSISKGFAFLTPYAGGGYSRSSSIPKGAAVTAGLQEETVNQSRAFVGLNANFKVMNFDFDIDSTGGTTTYSGKFGLRF